MVYAQTRCNSQSYLVLHSMLYERRFFKARIQSCGTLNFGSFLTSIDFCLPFTSQTEAVTPWTGLSKSASLMSAAY